MRIDENTVYVTHITIKQKLYQKEKWNEKINQFYWMSMFTATCTLPLALKMAFTFWSLSVNPIDINCANCAPYTTVGSCDSFGLVLCLRCGISFFRFCFGFAFFAFWDGFGCDLTIFKFGPFIPSFPCACFGGDFDLDCTGFFAFFFLRLLFRFCFSYSSYTALSIGFGLIPDLRFLYTLFGGDGFALLLLLSPKKSELKSLLKNGSSPLSSLGTLLSFSAIFAKLLDLFPFFSPFWALTQNI